MSAQRNDTDERLTGLSPVGSVYRGDVSMLAAAFRSPGAIARTVLAVIRLINGATALLAPELLARRGLAVDPEVSPGLVYALRLFGVRTVLIGLQLVSRDPAVRSRAVDIAPLIHASDVGAAVAAGMGGQVPRRAAVKATAISTVNVLLSLVALREQRAAHRG
jgi:hypothetical protein